MFGVTLAKAKIINLDRTETIEVMFNPKELNFSKSNSLTPTQTGANLPQTDFRGGEPSTLAMDLFFDTYKEQVDVRRRYTDRILSLMMIDPATRRVASQNDQGRPPHVRFQWGAISSFRAIITSITQNFTLFLPEGTPVRAKLHVQFREVVDEQQQPPQNPTSRGDGGERIWTVNDGDTLSLIAHREYGDTSKWRLIAEANNLIEVRRPAPGTKLLIPNAW